MSVDFVEVGRGVSIVVRSGFVVVGGCWGGCVWCEEQSHPAGRNPNRREQRSDKNQMCQQWIR